MSERASAIKRMARHSIPEPMSGCTLWIGAVVRGYGSCSFRGRSCRAHRVAWILANGEIPAGMCVLHRCDNPSCVNVAHLRLGTQYANMQDMIAKGRMVRTPPRTHCPSGHPYAGRNLVIRKRGTRECRQCKNTSNAKWGLRRDR